MLFLSAECVGLTNLCWIPCADLTVLVGHSTLHLFVRFQNAGLADVSHSKHFILVGGSVKNSASYFATFVFLFKFQKRVFRQLLQTNSVALVSLKTLGQEKSALNWQWLPCLHLVFALVDLRDQVFHLVAMEWRLTHQKLVANNSKRPYVNFVTVASLLKQLRGTVKRSPANTELRLCIIKNCTQSEIGDHCLEINFGQICRH